ncbi:MAG: S1 RNA-binding domain-containing protein, partial [Clostridia bacterium]|nr:S1 RNA-binding domain-containing protein [Clostridia bacterium]
KLASESDIMLVIGSRKSSNTQKLIKICTEFCKNSFLVENVEDIQLTFDSTNKYNVGIVAGASTPSWVIKEVTSFMDQINKDMGEMNFAEELEKSFVTLTNGQIVKGTVIGKDDQGVIVNVGFKSDGIVSYNEYSDDPNFTPDQIELGTEIEVKVLRVNDAEGIVVLSKKRVDQQKFSLAIEEAYNSATPIQATVTETVNGGVIAMYGPVRIFVPASQVTSRRVKDFNDYVGNTYDIKIIEFKKPRKIIGSIKAIADAKRKAAEAELWANIEENKEYTGVVKNLTNFGAFVDIGGVDGLVHLSELSWQRIRHANEVLKTGDEINVFVKDFNPETKKISLGYRREEDNPWADAENKYAVGNIVTATVMRMVPFGVFVEIVPGVDALVHISQISSVRIPTPEAVLSVGQVVEAKVIEADFENKKINLSIKEVAPIDPVSEEQPEEVEAVAEPVTDNDTDETVIEI